MARSQGRVALVTGAGKGIGRAVARALATDGATVVATSRTLADLQELATESPNCRPEPGDLCDEAFVDRLFAEIASRHGRLDYLVNAAGVGGFARVQDTTTADFRRTLDVNLVAAFSCTKRAIALMAKHTDRTARIVNIASVRSYWTERGEAGAYNASKFGLYGMTESIARELHGSDGHITISLVSPGMTDTALSNPRKLDRPDILKPETVADAVLYVINAPETVNIFDVTLFPLTQKPW